MSSQRTDAEKATVCFPVLVRSLGLYNFVWKHIWYYTHEYFLRIENNFEAGLVADLYALYVHYRIGRRISRHTQTKYLYKMLIAPFRAVS